MALANYADLIAALPSWSNKNNLTARLPDFVALAEARMGSDLSVKALERVQNATISAGDLSAGKATLPDDVIETQGLRIVGATVPDIEVTSLERLELLDQASYSGNTTYAAFVGRDVHLYPNATGTLQVRAKCRVPSLQTNSTNWLMTNYPNAYLFACLMEIANYNFDDAGFARWERRYAEAIGQANKAITYRGQMAASVVHGVR